MKNLIAILAIFLSFLGNSAQGLESNVSQNKAPQILDVKLIPTGFGLTKLLKEDYFLASLLIDKDAIFQGAEELVYIDAARRMEFKFVADRKISGRTFGRQMAESIKINNEKEALLDSISQVKQFIGMFRRSIKKGDVLRFDYHASFGTRVYLNKRRLGEIPYSSVFYRLLLNTWLGERPPSSEFKSGILGRNGDDYAVEMQKRYQET